MGKPTPYFRQEREHNQLRNFSDRIHDSRIRAGKFPAVFPYFVRLNLIFSPLIDAAHETSHSPRHRPSPLPSATPSRPSQKRRPNPICYPRVPDSATPVPCGAASASLLERDCLAAPGDCERPSAARLRRCPWPAMGKEGASGCSRFVLPLPDRNRHVPVRNIPFPISRNISFVFPSGLPVPVSVPGKKIQEREWLRHFPDRFHPLTLTACNDVS